jgi:uncharacterized protein (DUF305 family)
MAGARCQLAASRDRSRLASAGLLVILILVAGLAAAAGWVRAAAPPLYTQDDLLFLTHMIMHHQQALDMAALVPSRSTREAFRRFARYVDGAQRSEIDQMNSLLEEAAARGIEIPHHEMHGDPPMDGMLSKAQMAALAAATGAEFERLWLQGMIYHHEGALRMARAQQERDFEAHRQPFGIDVLADNIVDVQRGEITKMQGWLKDWGLAGPTDETGNNRLGR